MANPNRYYSATAVRTALTAGITATATSMTVGSTTGWPSSTPFTLMLDAETASEEIVTVTAVSGTTLTITRGEDGTSAAAHSTGADVRHAASARDFREPQEHIAATTGVHGVGAGTVVGTTATQTLTGKTMSGSSNTFTNIPKSALPTDVTYLTSIQTLSGKSMNGASNTFTNIPKSAIPSDTIYAADTQTLTNKTISGSSNTLTSIADGSITGLSASKLSGTVAKANLPSDTVYGAYNAGGSTFLTAATGWSVDASARCQSIGRVYVLEIVCQRTGATITANSAGNFADEQIAVIASTVWRPDTTMYVNFVGFDTSGGASVLSSGSVYLLDMHPNSTISTGDKVRVMLTFIK